MTLDLRVPPVALVLVCTALMSALGWLTPTLTWVFPGQLALAAVSIVGGAAVALAGVMQFRRAKTTVNPLTPTASSSLVVAGVYRWTRNPMYLGFALALLGVALYLGNVVAGVIVPAFIAYMNRFQIKPEERALATRFGQALEDYCRSVRRWL